MWPPPPLSLSLSLSLSDSILFPRVGECECTHTHTHTHISSPSLKSSRHVPPLQYLIGPNTCPHTWLFPPYSCITAQGPLPAWTRSSTHWTPSSHLVPHGSFLPEVGFIARSCSILVGMSTHHGLAYFIILCTPLHRSSGYGQER